jgi:hypothetical protein
MVFTDLSQLFDAGKRANREPAVGRAVDSSVQPSGGSFRRTKSGPRIEGRRTRPGPGCFFEPPSLPDGAAARAERARRPRFGRRMTRGAHDPKRFAGSIDAEGSRPDEKNGGSPEGLRRSHARSSGRFSSRE